MSLKLVRLKAQGSRDLFAAESPNESGLITVHPVASGKPASSVHAELFDEFFTDAKPTDLPLAIAGETSTSGNGAAPAASSSTKKPAAKKRKAKTGSRYPGSKPQIRAKARRMWEVKGMSAHDIAREVGVTSTAVYQWKKKDDWADRGTVADTGVGRVEPHEPAAAGPKSPSQDERPGVPCPSCELRTTEDPCSNCGQSSYRLASRLKFGKDI